MVRFAEFEEVKGYATRDNAIKRGNAVAATLGEKANARFVVISLPNGRFAPCFIGENVIHLAHQTNVCVVN